MTLAHVSKNMASFQTILFHNLSLTIAHFFFFAKKLSKLCFSISGNSAENKSVLSFLPSFSCQKIQRTNRLRIILILPSPSCQKIQKTNRLRIFLILPLPFKQKISKDQPPEIYFVSPYKDSRD